MNSQLKTQDRLVISMAVISLLLSCVISSSRLQFWLDELFTFNLVTDHSLSHMLTALSNHADGGLPLYYILMWGWVKVFGNSEVIMRIFSSLCISLSFFIVWKVMRRFFDFWPVAITTTFIFLTTRQLLWQNCEARFYGLFFLFCTLGLWQYVVLMDKGREYSWRDLLINAGIQGAMVLTHVFGFIYSGTFLLAFMVGDWSQRIFRPKVYLSVILGWACFFTWLGPFLIQKDLIRPHNWLPMPELKELINFYSTGLVLNMPILIMLIFIVNMFNLFFTKRDNYQFMASEAEAVNTRYYGPLLAVGLLLVIIPPIFTWVASIIAVPIFLPRYMVVSSLGWLIILTYFVNLCLPLKLKQDNEEKVNYPGKNKLRFICHVLIAGIILYPLAASLIIQKRHYDDIKVYPELPIAFMKPIEFMPRAHYYPKKNRYYFILDWDIAMDDSPPPSPLSYTVDYKIFAAIKKYYPYYNILQSKEFLTKYDRFLVYNDEQRNKWVKIRLLHNPNYKCTPLYDDILLVEKINK